MPKFSSKFSPMILVTKSQLFKLAFESGYKDAFIEWLHHQIEQISNDLPLTQNVSENSKGHLTLHVTNPKYGEDQLKSLMRFVRIPKLIYLLSPKFCSEHKIAIPDSLKIDVSPYNGLKDLFQHSSDDKYVTVIDDVLNWLYGILKSDSAYEKRIHGMITVLDDIINNTARLLSNQSTQVAVPPKTDQSQSGSIDLKSPILITPVANLNTQVVISSTSDPNATDHLSQGRNFLDHLKTIRLENINTQRESITDINFAQNFRKYFLITLDAIKTDLIDHVQMIGVFAEKQEQIDTQANHIYSVITLLSSAFRHDATSLDEVLQALANMDTAMRTIHEVMSSVAAFEADSGMNNTLINAHQFQVYKALQMLMISINPDDQSIITDEKAFADLQYQVLTTLYQLGSILERTQLKFKHMVFAREYVADLIANKDTRQKETEKLEASADKLEYPFEPRIKKLIDQIKGKEKSLKNKQDLHLEWKKTSFAEHGTKALTNNTEMTALSALIGLDKHDINQIQQAESFRRKDSQRVDRSNSLLTVAADYLLRELSKYFYVINDTDNQSYFIDFQLYEQNKFYQPQSLEVKSTIDRNYLRYMKAQYDTIAQTRRTETVKLLVFKIIYQTYYLPFEYFDLDTQNRIYIRKDLHRLKPKGDKLHGAALDIDKRFYQSFKSFNDYATQTLLTDADIQDVIRIYGKLDVEVHQILLESISACQATFMHNVSFWTSLLSIDQTGASTSILIPNDLWRTNMRMFRFISAKDLTTSYPLQEICEVCHEIFPKWWTSELQYNFIFKVMTDDKFCQYKKTLEKLKDNIVKLFSGGALIGQPNKNGQYFSYEYKRRIVSAGLNIINIALKGSLGTTLSNNPSLNTSNLIEHVVRYLNHMIVKDSLDYDKKVMIVRTLLGDSSNLPKSISPYVQYLVQKLFNDAVQITFATQVPQEKMERIITRMKSKFAPVLKNISRTYDLPEERLNGLIENARPQKCIFLRNF